MFKMLKDIKIKEILKEYKFQFIYLIVFSLVLFALDITTKWLAYNLLGPVTTITPENGLPFQKGQSIVVIPHLLEFTLITNNGAAFGFLSSETFSRILFAIVSWLVFLILPFGMVIYYHKYNRKIPKLYYISLVLIFGGNLGNLIDRTFYWNNPCGVIDFLDITQLIPGFGIFNLADSFVVIAVFILLIALVIDIFKGDKEKEELKEIKETKSDEKEDNNR